MKRNWEFLMLLGVMAFVVGGCSSSQTTEEGEDEESEEASEADTDDIPDESAESVGDYSSEQMAPSTQVEPQMSLGADGQYTVQKDDTLMKIAFEFYSDIFKWRKVFQDNQDKIQDPNNIPTGAVLRVAGAVQAPQRNGEKYLIKNGDTLGTISNNVYGATAKWRALWDNNRDLIKDPNKIYAGFFLYYLPNSDTISPAPLAGSEMPVATPLQAVAPTTEPSVTSDEPTTDDESRAPSSDDEDDEEEEEEED